MVKKKKHKAEITQEWCYVCNSAVAFTYVIIKDKIVCWSCIAEIAKEMQREA